MNECKISREGYFISYHLSFYFGMYSTVNLIDSFDG